MILAASASSTTGTSTSPRSRRSGAAAASSAPRSWTGSEPRTTPIRTCPTCSPTTGFAAGDRAARLAAEVDHHGRHLHGVPVPALRAALDYYDTLRADRLPAALIQGQRDYFGAHTYQRTDQEGTFHTLWERADRSETEVI